MFLCCALYIFTVFGFLLYAYIIQLYVLKCFVCYVPNHWAYQPVLS